MSDEVEETEVVDAEGEGLGTRYEVRKISDPEGKHIDCKYFVLDVQHDPIAREALAQYAQVARANGLTALASDLDEWLVLTEYTPLAQVSALDQGYYCSSCGFFENELEIVQSEEDPEGTCQACGCTTGHHTEALVMPK